MTTEVPRLRLGVLGVVVLSLFAALLGRLWYLQGVAAPEYRAVAEQNLERTVQLDPVRGRILDRRGRPLAENRPSTIVTVDRSVLRDNDERKELWVRLAQVLGKYPAELEERYLDGVYSPLLPLPVAEDVDEAVIVYLRERAEEFPGVEGKLTWERVYPYGTMASHVVGYVGKLSSDEFEARGAEGYELDDVIGKSGIEASFEEDLRGTPGSVTYIVDARGRILEEKERVDPIPGRDITLTIDLGVQSVAEQALLDGIIRARNSAPDDYPFNRFQAPGGSIVVLDPNNGSVLAMASYPNYDPREFVKGMSQDRYDQLNSEKRFFNRAIEGQYAPGSTFKVVPAWAAVQAGLVAPGAKFYDPGYYTVPDCSSLEDGQCTFYNPGDRAHGGITMVEAITVSSDVYFYSIGAEFKVQSDVYGDAIQDQAVAMGLGQETGIALPGEAVGRIPTPESKQALHDANPEAFPYGQWFTGDSVNVAIGQGDVLVTPLQLANVYATVANGGKVLAPNIVLQVTEPVVEGETTRIVRQFGPRIVRQLAMPDNVRTTLVEGLMGVVRSVYGTANGAFQGFPTSRYPIAGKTGTAQTGRKEAWKDTSLFVGFGPVGSPNYVVVAVLEEAGFGAQAAAPTVRQVFEVLAGEIPTPEVVEAPPLGETQERPSIFSEPEAVPTGEAYD